MLSASLIMLCALENLKQINLDSEKDLFILFFVLNITENSLKTVLFLLQDTEKQCLQTQPQTELISGSKKGFYDLKINVCF